jgi:hypothetical protein
MDDLRGVARTDMALPLGGRKRTGCLSYHQATRGPPLHRRLARRRSDASRDIGAALWAGMS